MPVARSAPNWVLAEAGKDAKSRFLRDYESFSQNGIVRQRAERLDSFLTQAGHTTRLTGFVLIVRRHGCGFICRPIGQRIEVGWHLGNEGIRMVNARFMISVIFVSVLGGTTSGQVPSREESIMQTSTTVLNEIMAVPLRSIPASLLARAHGIAIFPSVVKGGFIVGVRHGSGVLLIRDEAGAWLAPAFATITGGNIGFQAGLQATDVVLVFTTKRSVERILTNQFAIGVDAAAAAGPVGRQASAATDGQLQAEIYSYSRSRGLFAGVSLDGSVIQIDPFANAAYYQTTPQGQTIVPRSATTLVSNVMTYTGEAVQAPAIAAPQPPLAVAGRTEADQLRDQLRRTAPELYERLDPQWNAYLSLPAAVFAGRNHPPLEELNAALARFDQIAADPRYQALRAIPQFQSTYGLLKHYQSTLAQDQAPLQLPPPPGSSRQPAR